MVNNFIRISVQYRWNTSPFKGAFNEKYNKHIFSRQRPSVCTLLAQKHFEGIHKIVGRTAINCKRVRAAEMSLFPNPCNAQLNIKVPENESSINVEIRDISGNIAYQDTLKKRNGYSSIDSAALALQNRMHFASVSTDKFSLHKVLSFYTE